MEVTLSLAKRFTVLSILGVAILGTGSWVFAGTMIYTDQASFLANVSSGYYLETFDSLPLGSIPNPQSFSQNGFSYSGNAHWGVV
jgi:hypothetical protein